MQFVGSPSLFELPTRLKRTKPRHSSEWYFARAADTALPSDSRDAWVIRFRLSVQHCTALRGHVETLGFHQSKTVFY